MDKIRIFPFICSMNDGKVELITSHGHVIGYRDLLTDETKIRDIRHLHHGAAKHAQYLAQRLKKNLTKDGEFQESLYIALLETADDPETITVFSKDIVTKVQKALNENEKEKIS